MSGGHWNYQGHRIETVLTAISADLDVRLRWPALGKLCGLLGPLLAECEHVMDYDLSGDRSIANDDDWEREQIGKILETVMKLAPDEWFPRGKSATIQAVQARMAKRLKERSDGKEKS